jgi:hypothetical protein
LGRPRRSKSDIFWVVCCKAEGSIEPKLTTLEQRQILAKCLIKKFILTGSHHLAAKDALVSALQSRLRAESTDLRPHDCCDAASSNSELFQDLGIPASDLQPDRVAMVF